MAIQDGRVRCRVRERGHSSTPFVLAKIKPELWEEPRLVWAPSSANQGARRLASRSRRFCSGLAERLREMPLLTAEASRPFSMLGLATCWDTGQPLGAVPHRRLVKRVAVRETVSAAGRASSRGGHEGTQLLWRPTGAMGASGRHLLPARPVVPARSIRHHPCLFALLPPEGSEVGRPVAGKAACSGWAAT